MEAKDITANRHHGEYVGDYDLEETALVKGDCGTSVRLRGGHIDISAAASALTGADVISGIIFTRIQTSAYSGPYFPNILMLASSVDFAHVVTIFYHSVSQEYVIQFSGNELRVTFTNSNLTSAHMIYFSINRNTNEIVLELNNNSKGSTVSSWDLFPFNFSSGWLGDGWIKGEENNWEVQGWFDEVALFDRELTSSELSDIYDECMEIQVMPPPWEF